jgi:hypothetical protein
MKKKAAALQTEEGTLNIHHKEQTAFFPMQPLRAVLKARYENHPAGHWLCFKLQLRMPRRLLLLTH